MKKDFDWYFIDVANSKYKEFKVNDYISLRLIGKYTELYVNGNYFIQCKRLIINIPPEEIETYNELDSIDEISELYKNYLIYNEIYQDEDFTLKLSSYSHNITTETEFWAHCSNLQAWAENNYDTRILHSNLAFPLLKELTRAGDQFAKKIFKEEIAKRIVSGFYPTIKYLIKEGYLNYLNINEIQCILENCKEKLELDQYYRLVHVIIKSLYWNVITQEKSENKILRKEDLLQLFLKPLNNSILSKYLRYYLNRDNRRLTIEMGKIINYYNTVGMDLCFDYSIMGMFDKLRQHCRTILSQDSKSSYPWKYLGEAYKKLGQLNHAKVAFNVYHLKEEIELKICMKKLRKIKLNHFFWRDFLRYFNRNHWRLRRGSRKNKTKKAQW